MSSALAHNEMPIPILVYHQIVEAPPKGSPFRSLYVSPAAFNRQMWFLKTLGYKGLSMRELTPYINGTTKGKVVGITFDDGYENNLTNAMPILIRHGFSSTCYVVSGLLGKTNIWDAQIGIPQVPLMDEAGLSQWTAGGQEVGSHTHQHTNLLLVDDDTSRDEILLGKQVLEASMNGVEARHFCYPYGRYAHPHAIMAREAGFETATTTRRGRCTKDDDLFELPRVFIGRSTNLAQFWLKVATSYEDLRGKRAVERQRVIDLQHAKQVPGCALRS
jgi:peptidoglycan/xylan/chitin deacetylase (PgdA/CDA1 family)